MKQYNSRTADKFVLRLPEGMRDRLISAAKDSKRSMNSEIIFRLENSLTPTLDPALSTTQVPRHSSGRWCPGVGELCVHGDFGIGKIEDFEIQSGSSVYAIVMFSDGRARIQLHPKTTLRPFTV